jgi:hypothetical protein
VQTCRSWKLPTPPSSIPAPGISIRIVASCSAWRVWRH